MTAGAVAQFVFRNATVNQVLAGYERALVDSEFQIKQRQPWGEAGYVHKAIWGGKAKAYLVGQIVPLGLGKLMKSGKRLGAEAQIYQHGNDVVVRMAVVPYMELFDRSEMFLLSQGIFEKITDDDFSREKLNEITQRMWALGYRWS